MLHHDRKHHSKNKQYLQANNTWPQVISLSRNMQQKTGIVVFRCMLENEAGNSTVSYSSKTLIHAKWSQNQCLQLQREGHQLVTYNVTIMMEKVKKIIIKDQKVAYGCMY